MEMLVSTNRDLYLLVDAGAHCLIQVMRTPQRAMSNTEKILEFLEAVPNGCCDDCISEQTGVEPRQSVNQICRRLEKDDTISRREGPCTLGNHSKKLNILAGKFPGPPEVA